MGREVYRETPIREWLEGLDDAHRAYAKGYAEQLSLGEPAPSAAGLDRGIVSEIRRRVFREWRRRIDAMPGSRP